MGLKLEIELQNGTIGDYHRISEVTVSNGQNTALVKIQLWKNEDVRNQKNKTPLQEIIVDVEISAEDNIIAQCYKGLRGLSDYENAKDV